MNEINLEKYYDGIRNFFKSSNGKIAVIGISGGKDSTVAAALCANALGKENVIGVLMPKGEQADIEDSRKLCKILDIKNIEVDIGYVFGYYWNNMSQNNIAVTKQASINLQPRLRMSLLYFVAQSIDGGRVINTTNACESFVGYGTLWGDTVGDFAVLKNLKVSEVVKIGDKLGLPYELVHKTPSDGLSGKSDEDNLKVTYGQIELYMDGKFDELTENVKNRIKFLHESSQFKRDMINLNGI